MNNEVLEKIEEYNKGGLFNEPITFSSSADAATFLKLFTPSIGSGFKPLKDKTIKLSVAHIVDTRLVQNDPAGTENYVRKKLALKIAEQLIEEDLIQIQSCEDIETMNTHFRATVKIVQE